MANNTARQSLKKADLLRATKIPEPTFEHWIDRRLIELNRDDVVRAGKGKPNLYGHRTAKKLAIAHKGTKLGLPANIAVELAKTFTDKPQRGRPLGEVFVEGTTWVTATDDGVALVVNTKSSDDVVMMLRAATIALNVNQIISAIDFDIGIVK
jgi:hypothetical protein